MEKEEVVCPLNGHLAGKGKRLRLLSEVEEVLGNKYVYFFHRVGKPYSRKEQRILHRIERALSSLLEERLGKSSPFLLEERLPDACLSCKIVAEEHEFWEPERFFRLSLPSKDPMGVSSRLYCLHQLEARLHCFFMNGGKKPYSNHEKIVLRRIKKLFVHELVGTPLYASVKGTHVRCVSKEEKEELKWERKDEVRLKHVSLYHYNPHSQKYKKIKEGFMKEYEAKFGKR